MQNHGYCVQAVTLSLCQSSLKNGVKFYSVYDYIIKLLHMNVLSMIRCIINVYVELVY